MNDKVLRDLILFILICICLAVAGIVSNGCAAPKLVTTKSSVDSSVSVRKVADSSKLIVNSEKLIVNSLAKEKEEIKQVILTPMVVKFNDKDSLVYATTTTESVKNNHALKQFKSDLKSVENTKKHSVDVSDLIYHNENKTEMKKVKKSNWWVWALVGLGFGVGLFYLSKIRKFIF